MGRVQFVMFANAWLFVCNFHELSYLKGRQPVSSPFIKGIWGPGAQKPIKIRFSKFRCFSKIIKMDSNLTVTVHKAKDLRINQTPIPEPKDNEVLIRMDSVGICGSDVHFWQDGGFGELIVRTPTTMGHEGAGIVDR